MSSTETPPAGNIIPPSETNNTVTTFPSPLPAPANNATPSSAFPPSIDGSSSPATNTTSSSSGRGLPPGALAGLVVGTVFGAVVVLIAVGICFFCYRRKKRKDTEASTGNNQSWNQYVSQPSMWPKPTPPPGTAGNPQPSPANIYPSVGSPSNSWGSENPPAQTLASGIPMGFSQNIFTYDELAKATDNFSSMNLIGQGGFGYVHKGFLPDGKAVAVKQLKSESKQGEREFQAEVQVISRVHHRHLVLLIGYCMTGSRRMLVYEFVPNKTLEFHLHEKGRRVMDWPTRMKIGMGAAKGLAYLHEDCQPKIIHRDVKATNILLDDSFEAKVADFGLAKLSPDTDTHVSTRIMGTFGYLAPEYAASGKLTDKSDVFSFGIVLLELITGRRPVDRSQAYADDSIVDWARPLMMQALEDGNFEALVDPRLENNYDTSEMTRMVACAAMSVRHSSRRRPKMSEVVRTLEGNMSVDELTQGSAPGHSTVYSLDGSSDYDTAMYKEDLQKFRKMALESQVYGSSEYSGATSERGQNPSSSSTEGHQTTQATEPHGVAKGKENAGKSS